MSSRLRWSRLWRHRALVSSHPDALGRQGHISTCELFYWWLAEGCTGILEFKQIRIFQHYYKCSNVVVFAIREGIDRKVWVLNCDDLVSGLVEARSLVHEGPANSWGLVRRGLI